MRAFFQTTLSLPVLFVLDLIVIAIVVAIPCIFGPRRWCRLLAGAALLLSVIGLTLEIQKPQPATTNEFDAAFGPFFRALAPILLLGPEMLALLVLTFAPKFGRRT